MKLSLYLVIIVCVSTGNEPLLQVFEGLEERFEVGTAAPFIFVPYQAEINAVEGWNWQTIEFPEGQQYIQSDLVPKLGSIGNTGRIVYGAASNPHWGHDQKVYELDKGSNNIYRSFFVTKVGKFMFSFDWAAFYNKDLTTSQLAVFLDGALLRQLTPTDYKIHRQVLMIEIKQIKTYLLQIKGIGRGDGFGATFSNMVLSTQRKYSKVTKMVQLSKRKLRAFGGLSLLQTYQSSSNLLINNMMGSSDRSMFNWDQPYFSNVAPGNIYNIFWKEEVVFELNGSGRTLEMKTGAGSYLISFEWAAVARRFNSHAEVRWNGIFVLALLARSLYIFSQSIIVKSSGNGDRLQFVGVSATVANLRVAKLMAHSQSLVDELGFSNPIALPSTYAKNLINNGDFEDSEIGFGEGLIKHWKIKVSGEVGEGAFYNSNWTPHTNVADLDSDTNKNNEYLQEFQASEGLYRLSFNYAAQQNKSFLTSQIDVVVNDENVISIIPNSYLVTSQLVILQLKEGTNSLVFIGSGSPDYFGATIDDIVINKYEFKYQFYTVSENYQKLGSDYVVDIKQLISPGHYY